MPITFEKLSELILKRICNTDASEIHFVCDRYFENSIKDTERWNRQEEDIPYTISGPSQKTPSDFQKNLKNKRFKEELVKFLSEHWEADLMSLILKDKKVFITVEDKCFSFIANDKHDKKVLKTEEEQLSCLHEEADTRMIFHLSKCRSPCNVMVKASDTDVLVIILGNMHK